MRFPAPLRLDTLRSAPLDSLGFAGLQPPLRLLLQCSACCCSVRLACRGSAWRRWADFYGGGRGSPTVFFYVEFQPRIIFTAVQPRPRLPPCGCVSSQGAKHFTFRCLRSAVLCCLRIRYLQASVAMEPLRMRDRRVSDLVLFLQVTRRAAALQQASLAQQVVKGGHRKGRSVVGPAPSLFPPPANASVLPFRRVGAQRNAPRCGPKGSWGSSSPDISIPLFSPGNV
jgi:hypothetical protein